MWSKVINHPFRYHAATSLSKKNKDLKLRSFLLQCFKISLTFRIHWTRIDSDGKVHFLFVRYLEKFRSCWMRGWKVVPMESIGSIGHE